MSETPVGRAPVEPGEPVEPVTAATASFVFIQRGGTTTSTPGDLADDGND